ncbi:hypothetical protein FT663_05477 [Candidozyma haemuli var. vulneris]|uniref:t-SNARE coiled-coil homology domain-containing protein n=1 Tax=Candidozyma haemuli TaxID=45357 RepID=A0A2V1ARB7_9ASCO|nr:hypothetical protein CXQ85_002068 [[Candida] haemuloni]KAF3984976.1 hypothetical protein FT663_05477 [[Candida] haemuloni var. vulneris]KAF3987012.1 hypothetical protein FT662_04243 [[Candida] haemuloni var. vulneris]PVH20282.1 hypothetical protein CXQ85_002068 [[Candida] haemuloni]
MSDLTPLFNQCVDIVSKELSSSIEHAPLKKKTPPYYVEDTFIKECLQLYVNLVNLGSFISKIRPFYLQVNDEFTRIEKSSSSHLGLEEKNKIDEEFKIKIQQTFEKMKFLQSYQRKQTELAESKKSKQGFMSSFFGTSDMDPETLYDITVASHRTQVLRFLNETATNVNRNFESMQRKRYDREKQLSLLHFQNIDDEDLNESADPFKSTYQFDVVADEDEKVERELSQLSQEQIQELKEENKELLTRKTNQFKQVEKLHHSIVDIVKLSSELSTHLETQAEQIDNLLDNQDQVDIDLRLGNKTLTKATSRNKRGSNLIVTTCIVLGVIILVLDYIVW